MEIKTFFILLYAVTIGNLLQGIEENSLNR
jgi:hypothetical protein